MRVLVLEDGLEGVGVEPRSVDGRVVGLGIVRWVEVIDKFIEADSSAVILVEEAEERPHLFVRHRAPAMVRQERPQLVEFEHPVVVPVEFPEPPLDLVSLAQFLLHLPLLEVGEWRLRREEQEFVLLLLHLQPHLELGVKRGRPHRSAGNHYEACRLDLQGPLAARVARPRDAAGEYPAALMACGELARHLLHVRIGHLGAAQHEPLLRPRARGEHGHLVVVDVRPLADVGGLLKPPGRALVRAPQPALRALKVAPVPQQLHGERRLQHVGEPVFELGERPPRDHGLDVEVPEGLQ
mmetsp:Transcript_54143/g.150241  ORF Transcript_54143/g.150241 Transcript_54143/m.150241 type:complete len:296 (+) Transcript_54143:235-1122(+)